MLGLRLDEPLVLEGLESAIDRDAVDRLARLELVELSEDGEWLALTERGRFLGGGVTAELLACS
jgi:hypothetical protein